MTRRQRIILDYRPLVAICFAFLVLSFVMGSTIELFEFLFDVAE